MAEIFRIVDEEGKWHIQGPIRDDAHDAAKLINIMYDVAGRKTRQSQKLKIEISNTDNQAELTRS